MPYGYDTVFAPQSQIPAIRVQLTQVEFRVSEYIQALVHMTGQIAMEKLFQPRHLYSGVRSGSGPCGSSDCHGSTLKFIYLLFIYLLSFI